MVPTISLYTYRESIQVKVGNVVYGDGINVYVDTKNARPMHVNPT